MTRCGRVLCVLYGAVSLWLIFCTVQQARYDYGWASFLFAGSSVLPLVAIVRELELVDAREAAMIIAPPRRTKTGPPPRRGGVEGNAECPLGCCERWWTALGTEHDSTCPRRPQR